MFRQMTTGCSVATVVTFLYRRTIDITVGTIHTAIPWKGSQNLAATFAVIKELTGACRHFLFLGMATVRTGDCRELFFQPDFHGRKITKSATTAQGR